MQFTGLQDNNKKDIYEGDTVSFDNTDSVIVVYEPIHAGFVGKIIKTINDENPTFCAFFGYSLYRNPQVIGNIYTTPDY